RDEVVEVRVDEREEIAPSVTCRSSFVQSAFAARGLVPSRLRPRWTSASRRRSQNQWLSLGDWHPKMLKKSAGWKSAAARQAICTALQLDLKYELCGRMCACAR